MAGPWTTEQGMILDHQPLGVRHGLKHPKVYPPCLIMIVDLECDG
jgi:hypothetical protein